MRRDRRLGNRVPLAARAAAGRDVVGESGDVRFEVVEPQQQRVHPSLLDVGPPFAPVHQQAEVPGDRVLLPSETEQLDLELSLVQRRRRPPA